MKQRTHTVTLRLTFDKQVSRAAALRAARNNLTHQEIYSSFMEEREDGWGKARIASVKRSETARAVR